MWQGVTRVGKNPALGGSEGPAPLGRGLGSVHNLPPAQKSPFLATKLPLVLNVLAVRFGLRLVFRTKTELFGPGTTRL